MIVKTIKQLVGILLLLLLAQGCVVTRGTIGEPIEEEAMKMEFTAGLYKPDAGWLQAPKGTV